MLNKLRQLRKKRKQGYKSSASVMLRSIIRRYEGERVSLGDIMNSLHEKGFAILMLFFALPCAVPALPPPLPSLVAIPLAFFAAQMILQRDSPWLPSWLAKRQIPRASLVFMLEKSARFLKKIERILRPRISAFSTKSAEQVIGFLFLFFAASIAIPLPATNLFPAIGIVIASIGILSKDGLFVIIGLLIGIIGSIFGFGLLIGMLIYGTQFVAWALSFI